MNGSKSGKETVSFVSSRITDGIVEALTKAGFVESFLKKGKKIAKTLEVKLAYDKSEPMIRGVRRVSKFSRRVYVKFGNLKPVRNGYGKVILTTPKGILTGDDARKNKVGGEVLFEIW
jgi:small subunit ribosomal protein S8